MAPLTGQKVDPDRKGKSRFTRRAAVLIWTYPLSPLVLPHPSCPTTRIRYSVPWEDILARHGVVIRRSTLCSWIAAAAELARPLYERMCHLVL